MRLQHVHVTHDFRAPVERVFAYLAEHENLASLFGTRVERVRDGEAERNGVGSCRRLSFNGLLPFEETVTEVVPNERIVYRITKGTPMREHEGVMAFAATGGGGTHLDYRIRFGSPVPGLAAIVAKVLHGNIARGLRKLAATCDAAGALGYRERVTTRARRNGDVSFWQASLAAPTPRPPLPGDRDADVCVVGAGFTGLWTAYHLKLARPDLDVVVLERERVGFGASGRNGGWLTPAFAAPPERLARTHGAAAVGALERALRESVADVLAVCERERIDCDALAGGVLRVARGPAQTARLRAAVGSERARGVGAEGLVELDAAALAARVRVAGASAATWSPHGVRVQPAKLVRGLAEAAERRGVRIYERTAVRELRAADHGRPRATHLDAIGRDATDASAAAVTDRGTVRAPVVLSCVEGFTPQLRGQRRALLPLNSAIVVTEPLSDAAWSALGWEGAELLGDAAHAYVYTQRTVDGRIALGGRGVPYRYGSRTDRDGRTQRRTVDGLARMLRTLFPAAREAAINHAWCGVLGVARDWQPAVRLDRATGLGFAGGYVGNGLAAAHLAGRTLRDLVLGEDSELTRLPWVGHTARRWEPEPLRWLGTRAVYALYRAADRREAASGSARTSALARAADLLAGR